MKQKKIVWIDHEREPQCQPNPRYPEGIDIDTAHGAREACYVPLPYPAKRCGIYVVTCACGLKVIVTTAGRRDDPRSIVLACK